MWEMWKKSWLNLALGLITILFILIFVFAFEYYPNYTGQDFGLFSALGAVFSGLGFVVIAFTLIYQYKQLQSQREQFNQQSFETTFFNMLATQRQIIEHIEYDTIINNRKKTFKGRDVFSQAKEDLIYLDMFSRVPQYGERVTEILKNCDFYTVCENCKIPQTWVQGYSNVDTIKNSIQNIKDNLDLKKTAIFLYEILLATYFSKYEHYFSHLYQILKYIQKNENEESKKFPRNRDEIKKKYQMYVDIVESQFSYSELFVLFSNSLRNTKMKEVLKYYRFLDNLILNSYDHYLLEDIYQQLYKQEFEDNEN